MLELIKDKNLLLPIVKKSDILYTKYSIKPNTITLFNGLIVTNLLLYAWMSKKHLLSIFFLYSRLILDGVDGYIARNHNQYTKNGEIYDHISDSVFMGYIFMTFLYKLKYNIIEVFIVGDIVMILSMYSNFDDNAKIISKKILGAGGSYDAYCTLNYIMAQLTIILIDYCVE